MSAVVAVLALTFSILSIAFQAFCMRYPTPDDAREAFRRLAAKWRR